MNALTQPQQPTAVAPIEAHEVDSYIPDTLFPTDNDWGIPLLDINMQAQECAIPILRFGEQARALDMKGNGTVHFYTDDYKFSAVYEHPEKILQHHPRNIIEPNFSTFLDMAPAFGLQAIYKKRVVSRMMQDKGIRVFVDLNVSQNFIKLNLLGVPHGWRAFATRGYTDRIGHLEIEYGIAEASAAQAGARPLFVVYGGGKKCQDFCKEVGAVYITPNLIIKNREKAIQQLLDDNIIYFADNDFSRQALEESKAQVRLDQAKDYGNKQIEN